VPRVIGKKGSMIKLLKQMTKCEITVGQNGNIWIKGERQMEDIVERAIFKIDQEAHIPGLTDRIKKILETELSR
jgi:exosome complex component RRP4